MILFMTKKNHDTEDVILHLKNLQRDTVTTNHLGMKQGGDTPVLLLQRGKIDTINLVIRMIEDTGDLDLLDIDDQGLQEIEDQDLPEIEDLGLQETKGGIIDLRQAKGTTTMRKDTVVIPVEKIKNDQDLNRLRILWDQIWLFTRNESFKSNKISTSKKININVKM